jgi:hypothetical protein
MFGDSIVDPGNNNNRITEAKANFPPYGQDFPGGVATGRFSNGLVPGDLLGTCVEYSYNVADLLHTLFRFQMLLPSVYFGGTVLKSRD